MTREPSAQEIADMAEIAKGNSNLRKMRSALKAKAWGPAAYWARQCAHDFENVNGTLAMRGHRGEIKDGIIQ